MATTDSPYGFIVVLCPLNHWCAIAIKARCTTLYQWGKGLWVRHQWTMWHKFWR